MPTRRRNNPGLERLEGRLVLSGLLVQGAGPGQAPVVRVLDAATGRQEFQFTAYDARMRSGSGWPWATSTATASSIS